jgi:hypothetical protein
MDALVAAGRLIALLEEIAYEKRACRFCHRAIYLVRTRHGTTAYSSEGIDHMQDCPRFQKQAAPAQDAFFPPDEAGAFEPSR